MARAKIKSRSRAERRGAIEALEKGGRLRGDVGDFSSSQESRSVVDLTDEPESEEDAERDMLSGGRAKRFRKDTVVDLAPPETSKSAVADAPSSGDARPAPKPGRKAKLTARAVKPLVAKASSRMVQDMYPSDSAIAAATPGQRVDHKSRSVAQTNPVATPPTSALLATPGAQTPATLRTPRSELLLPATVRLMDATESSASEPPPRRPPHLQRYFTQPAARLGKLCFRCGCPSHRGQPCCPLPKQPPCCTCTGFHPQETPCPGGITRGSNLLWLESVDKQMAVDVAQGLCTRCGRKDCFKDRDGACSYDPDELAHVRCISCGRLGHLCCAPASTLPCQPACAGCGSSAWEGRGRNGRIDGGAAAAKVAGAPLECRLACARLSPRSCLLAADTHVALQCKTEINVKAVKSRSYYDCREYKVSRTFVGQSRWAKLLTDVAL